MRFWDKAGRVLGYKQRTLMAARKKVVMDKHLDFLVGQTQRYSTLLAERLTATEADGTAGGGTSGASLPLALPEVYTPHDPALHAVRAVRAGPGPQNFSTSECFT